MQQDTARRSRWKRWMPGVSFSRTGKDSPGVPPHFEAFLTLSRAAAALLLLALFALACTTAAAVHAANIYKQELAYCRGQLQPIVQMMQQLPVQVEQGAESDSSLPSAVLASARARPLAQMMQPALAAQMRSGPPASGTQLPSDPAPSALNSARPAAPMEESLSLTLSSSLPAPPPPYTLSSAELQKLEEPWGWFQRAGEHRDLVAKVKQLRQQKGRPLVIIDVGLNIGSAPWALVQSGVCEDCVVYGFEPIPKYFAFAQFKLPHTRYPNVHLFNYALCDHDGPEQIWMDPGSNIGWNTLLSAERSGDQVSIPISCVRLDSLWSSGVFQPHARVDLIKIDTEGAERMVIQGMRSMIQQHSTPKPWLYIEVGWGKSRKDWQEEIDAFEFLFHNGYHNYDISKIDGTSMHWITPKE